MDFQGFFRRTVRQKLVYKPCENPKGCLIMRISRNRCQYCRMQRCIVAGMSHEGNLHIHAPMTQTLMSIYFHMHPKWCLSQLNLLRRNYVCVSYCSKMFPYMHVNQCKIIQVDFFYILQIAVRLGRCPKKDKPKKMDFFKLPQNKHGKVDIDKQIRSEQMVLTIHDAFRTALKDSLTSQATSFQVRAYKQQGYEQRKISSTTSFLFFFLQKLSQINVI